jgi:predicted outer membrane repeat protein
VVTTNADVVNPSDGFTSLREALAYATTLAGPQTITFAPALSGQTILVTNGQLALNQNLTIDGSSLANAVQINGNHLSSIFAVSGGADVVLNSLTLTNGYAGSGGSGGAIVNSGTLALNHCTLAGNSANGDGGAIWNGGPLTLTACTLLNNIANFAGAVQNYSPCTLVNCTLTGNYATNNGGAIDSDFSAVLTLTQCTFFGNTAGGVGGAVDNYLSTLNVGNSILAGDSGGGDLYSWSGSTVNVYGTNIVPVLYSLGTNGGTGAVLSSAPLLAALGNYGGPTQTMPPLRGSPAIDAGSDAVAAGMTTDQRGYPRVSGAHVDIGSVEAQLATTSPELADAYWSSSNQTFQFSFTNLVGGSFTVFANTNVTAPSGTWTIIGTAVEVPPGSGQFEFSDPQATNYSHRFYRVGSP